MAAAGAGVLLASVVELGEVAVLDETEPEGDVAPGDEDLGLSCSSFLMLTAPDWPLAADVDAGDVVDEEALWPPPIGGNTIRIPDPEFPDAAAVFFGCNPTAFATALMIAALEKLLAEAHAPEGTGVVEPFVLLLLLVFICVGTFSEPLVDCCWAYSVL